MLKVKRMMTALVAIAASTMPGCMVPAGPPTEVDDVSTT